MLAINVIRKAPLDSYGMFQFFGSKTGRKRNRKLIPIFMDSDRSSQSAHPIGGRYCLFACYSFSSAQEIITILVDKNEKNKKTNSINYGHDKDII